MAMAVSPLKTSTECNKKGGEFMAVKKNEKKFKGIRKEK
jgi:hypothetical protein